MSQATDLADCSARELLELYRQRARLAGRSGPGGAGANRAARIRSSTRSASSHPKTSAARGAGKRGALEARGEPAGDLDGVPVSIKDLILARGWPTLRGSRTVDPQQAWDVDAPASARLREAGAVILGKTTTPEFGCKGETNSPLTGITRNPWDPRKTPGGSSGGTAAAVASGMGPLSVGTDGAGSVRIPAGFCGNFGLKPSFGRVPGLSALADGYRRPPRAPRHERRRRGADDERAEAPRRPRLDLAALRRPRLPSGPRRRRARPAHRLLADPRLREERASRSRRRRGGRGARARIAGRAGRGGRPGHRRSARDHHRPLVRRRRGDLERLDAGAAEGRRSRTFAPRRSSARATAPSTSIASTCAAASSARTCASSCSAST